MRALGALGIAATTLLMACASAPEVPTAGEPRDGAEATDAPEKTATVSSELAAEGCDWRAIGDAMDRMTAMCTSWGYDQGIFRFSGCRVTLDHCISW